MPEHDPIQDLEALRTGGILVTPLPAPEVRRLGDRRRSRRRAGVALVAAAAVAAVAVPVGMMLLDDGGNEPRVAEPPQTTVTYPGNGLFVETPAEAGNLTGASPEFVAYIALQATRAAQVTNEQCPGAAHGVTVKKYSTQGYALGSVNDCGGAQALWRLTADGWRLGMATQDAWDCDTLAYLDVPQDFVGECFDEAGGFGPDQAGGLELGMSRTAIKASGGGLVGSDSDSAGGSCLTVYLASGGGAGRGAYDPERGLVEIGATSNDKTPERIGLGSSEAKLRDVYPAATPDGDGWRVPLADGASYRMTVKDGRVTAMSLVSADYRCS